MTDTNSKLKVQPSNFIQLNDELDRLARNLLVEIDEHLPAMSEDVTKIVMACLEEAGGSTGDSEVDVPVIAALQARKFLELGFRLGHAEANSGLDDRPSHSDLYGEG